MTHFTISPEGTATSTERGFDDPDFQRCDGCDSGLIVEDPDQSWPCPFCSHVNAVRNGDSLPPWDWYRQLPVREL